MIIWIVLTVIAWKRGWGKRALLPLGGAFSCGFILGLAGVVATPESSVFSLIGLVAFVALIGMALTKPTDAATTPQPLPSATTYGSQYAYYGAAAAPVAAFCPSCGGQRSSLWRFCHYCGIHLA